MILSSLKLRLENFTELKPWLLLSIIDEEFVQLTLEEVEQIAYAFEEKPVGSVKFNNQTARLYKEDEMFLLRFADGRTFKATERE